MEVVNIIENRQMHSRAIAYDDLQFGHDRPSDLDGLMVLPNATIVIEYKCGEKRLVPKQRMVLETLVNDAVKAGKRALAMVARYYDRDPRNTVNAALCLVTEVYTDGKWYEVRACGLSLKQAMERFMKGDNY